MTDPFTFYLIGAGFFAISGISEYFSYNMKKEIKNLELYSLLTDKTLAGYYYTEGFLESANPILKTISNKNYEFLICKENDYRTEKALKTRISTSTDLNTGNHISKIKNFSEKSKVFLKSRFNKTDLKLDGIDVSNLYNKFDLDFIVSIKEKTYVPVTVRGPSFDIKIIPSSDIQILNTDNELIVVNSEHKVLKNNTIFENKRYIKNYITSYYGILNKYNKFTIIGYYNRNQFDINSIVTHKSFNTYLSDKRGEKDYYNIVAGTTGILGFASFLIGFFISK